MIILFLIGWLALLYPLWRQTLAVQRVPLDHKTLEYYDVNIDSLLEIHVPVTVVHESNLPDVVEAMQAASKRILSNAKVPNWHLDFTTEKVPNALELRIVGGDTNAYVLSPNKSCTIFYEDQLFVMGGVPELAVQILVEKVFAPELVYISRNASLPAHVAAYSPGYHLSFNLFVGDGRYYNWDIKSARNLLEPVFEPLGQLFNFTTDSQVERYARPGSLPTKEDSSFSLDKDSLSTFINFAEWPLASTAHFPSINFVTYIPAKDQSPLTIPSASENAFLAPQWGSVYILNPESQDLELSAETLLPAMDVFASHLLSLLGAPKGHVQMQIDAVTRITAWRAIRNAAASLGSLSRLLKSMKSIPIPADVSTNANRAVQNLEAALVALAEKDTHKGARLGGLAFVDAEKAFFDKRMVSQTFFPEENILAIYLPLLLPLFVVLVVGVFRYLSERKWPAKFKELVEKADADAAKEKARLEEKLDQEIDREEKGPEKQEGPEKQKDPEKQEDPEKQDTEDPEARTN